ncbi:MAG TPA: UDP-glucose 4-epimerase GalE [Candidatus Nanoarchaeia archaeon]|nr:UDP-glucose 4-epimerase GalE [Candidatus Nanoarchaeia archaeon]
MKVLVTGGAGYIGSHVVRRLLQKNHEVIMLDNLSRGHIESVPKEAVFIKGDLADKKVLEKLFSEYKIDAVMHFAAFAYVGESIKEPKKYFKNNVENGLNLLDACARHGVKKFIFSSSCAVYGTPENLPITEDSKKHPESPYGETKMIFENHLADYDRKHGLKFISLRYFNAAGADDSGEIGEHHDPETHLIPLVLGVALGKRENIAIFGKDYPTNDGTCMRDYVHVNDLADAHLLALENLGKESKFYNVGTGSGYSVKEIVDACTKITGHDIPVVDEARRQGDPPALYADSSKIKKELGWKPKYDLGRIIETAWKWHKNHPNGY